MKLAGPKRSNSLNRGNVSLGEERKENIKREEPLSPPTLAEIRVTISTTVVSAVGAAAEVGAMVVGVLCLTMGGIFSLRHLKRRKKENTRRAHTGMLRRCHLGGGRGQQRERDNVRATYLDDKSIYNPSALLRRAHVTRDGHGATFPSPSVRIPMGRDCEWCWSQVPLLKERKAGMSNKTLDATLSFALFARTKLLFGSPQIFH